MNDSFKAGALDAMEKHASTNTAKAVKFLSNPEVFGAISGAALGYAVSPQDDRSKHMIHGAVIGSMMGSLRRPKSSARLHTGVGGPVTSTAVPGGLHGIV
jgi:hypothetical protein